jgi:hypothetical protein
MKISIIFRPDGSNITEVSGTSGSTCEQETEFLGQLGTGSTQYKLDYYQSTGLSQMYQHKTNN